MKHVLITGGAGFIGSHLCDELLEAGYRVSVLDCLSEQVHGPGQRTPEYLSADVELIIGDVRDQRILHKALDGIDTVFHFAAAVGVGQSMYEIAHYTSVNNVGTAVLLEELSKRSVERLIVASSMSIYGEGAYRDGDRIDDRVSERPMEQLRRGEWELSKNGAPLAPIPTPETKAPMASSVYALSKYDQERLCLIVGKAYGISTTALRFFNVYGPRQALSNPYTGVLAIFASRCMKGAPCLIYEDGEQKRDFVNVHDLARACRLALESTQADGEVFNVGSGRPVTIREVADEVARTLDCADIEPHLTRKYRVGDVRHCFADITKARQILGYEPRVAFRDGLQELAGWLEGQQLDSSAVSANDELKARGLMV